MCEKRHFCKSFGYLRMYYEIVEKTKKNVAVNCTSRLRFSSFYSVFYKYENNKCLLCASKAV